MTKRCLPLSHELPFSLIEPGLVKLPTQVETLRASGSGAGSGEGLFVELKTTIMRVEDLQAQVITAADLFGGCLE